MNLSGLHLLVKESLAQNFDLLSQDMSESVRERVACNKKVPAHILKRLANDPVRFVHEAALKRMENY